MIVRQFDAGQGHAEAASTSSTSASSFPLSMWMAFTGCLSVSSCPHKSSDSVTPWVIPAPTVPSVSSDICRMSIWNAAAPLSPTGPLGLSSPAQPAHHVKTTPKTVVFLSVPSSTCFCRTTPFDSLQATLPTMSSPGVFCHAQMRQHLATAAAAAAKIATR